MMKINPYLYDLEKEEVREMNQPYSPHHKLSSPQLALSRAVPILVKYNYISIGSEKYSFYNLNENEIKIYFERMKRITSSTINELIEHSDKQLHFHRSHIRGKLRTAMFEKFPNRADDNTEIYHFALYTRQNANREADVRSPRIYFMLGEWGHIYPLFYDPYHELNPI